MIEIILKDESQIKSNELVAFVRQILSSNGWNKCSLLKHLMGIELIKSNVDKIRLDIAEDFDKKCLKDIQIFIYKLSPAGYAQETLEDDDTSPATHEWIMPSCDFDGLWESLSYEDNVKEHLLKYTQTSIKFAASKVDNTIINFNKMIILHGPPGTGKTSLCKSLAQKLSIILAPYYSGFYLIEINTHSLFSKWFSESGKLVVKLFSNILRVVNLENTMVCVLIDEVESLTMSRQNLANDPSDSIRVVNAVLTQLDILKRHENVLILATTNISGKIDEAFLDRADLKIYIGPPGETAIFKILNSCVDELQRSGLIIPFESSKYWDEESIDLLKDISRSAAGLSGRTLRKLPVIAATFYLPNANQTYQLMQFLKGLKSAVEYYKENEKKLIH